MDIRMSHSGLHLWIRVTDDGDARLIHFGTAPCAPGCEDEAVQRACRLLELQVTGENFNEHHASKGLGTSPAQDMRYVSHREVMDPAGPRLEITLSGGGLTATVHYQFYNGTPALRAWTTVCNTGSMDRGIEYLTSFCYTGLSTPGGGAWDQKSRVHIVHNTWTGEYEWRRYTVDELGLNRYNPFCLKRISLKQNGTWSASEFLPMGLYENTATGEFTFWQIESSGAWYWELGDVCDRLYLHLCGPCEQENHWWKCLRPGQTFTSVPVAVGAAYGFDGAIAALTGVRRAIRRDNEDNRRLPVIFNDYMNCLFADPTTEKELPLIDAASQAGCEIYCIDAGWYDDGDWWDTVGEWMPAKTRWSGGLKQVLDIIRAHGMVPGLWLELEVIGIHSPMVKNIKPEWVFMRHGKMVIDHGRYQLDFRNPEVIAFADSVIDRLVGEYGVGYIKMDYNINGGIGTEVGSDSLGDGLLEHTRAYLCWLDRVFARYPDLIIENCGSGGMRTDYALLSRLSIQSTSDQTDYRKYAVIAANAPIALCPEQAAVWSYPLTDADEEETVFNMVNALTLRIHQSGHLANLSAARLALVKEGIALYRSTLREHIPRSVPLYPLGPARFHHPWMVRGLRDGDTLYLTVWHTSAGQDSLTIPLPGIVSARQIYPAGRICPLRVEDGAITVTLPAVTARLYEVTCRT